MPDLLCTAIRITKESDVPCVAFCSSFLQFFWEKRMEFLMRKIWVDSEEDTCTKAFCMESGSTKLSGAILAGMAMPDS